MLRMILVLAACVFGQNDPTKVWGLPVETADKIAQLRVDAHGVYKFFQDSKNTNQIIEMLIAKEVVILCQVAEANLKSLGDFFLVKDKIKGDGYFLKREKRIYEDLDGLAKQLEVIENGSKHANTILIAKSIRKFIAQVQEAPRMDLK